MEALKKAESLLRWAVDHQFESEDYYWKEQACYPMALGYFLRAACVLRDEKPENPFFREVSEDLVEKILSRSNLLQKSSYPHWGLPFPWPTLEDTGSILAGDFFWDPDNPLFTGELPAHAGYGVTTAIVGQGLLDYFVQNAEARLREVLEGVGKWLLQDCGYREIGDRVFFNYAPNMKHEIYNGSALVAAYLGRAGRQLEIPEWVDLAERGMALMVEVQDAEGGWIYAKEREEIEYHYGYNLESLALFQEVRPTPPVLDAIRRGADFYWERLIDPDGKCYDNIEKQTETRLWAYGWAISAFCHVAAVTGDSAYLEYARRVADTMIQHHWVPEEGAFRFKPDDPSFYMRDEAHVAYGLALLAAGEKPTVA